MYEYCRCIGNKLKFCVYCPLRRSIITNVCSTYVRIVTTYSWYVFFLRSCQSNRVIYQAVWAENTDFSQILVSPTMLLDQLPEVMFDAMKKVQSVIFLSDAVANTIDLFFSHRQDLMRPFWHWRERVGGAWLGENVQPVRCTENGR